MGEKSREQEEPEQNHVPESTDSGKEQDWSNAEIILAERRGKKEAEEAETQRVANMTPEEFSEEVIKKIRDAETPEQVAEARRLGKTVFQKLGAENNTPKGKRY